MKKIYKMLSLVLILSICFQIKSKPIEAADATEPYIGEIKLIAGNFAPKGWAKCDGQLMPIAQNTALFSILGTTYGGDGKSTFALPNLNGSAAVGAGAGPGLSPRFLGEVIGDDTNTLLQSEIPVHNHGNIDLKLTVSGSGTLNAYNNIGNTSNPGNTNNKTLTKGLRNERLFSADALAAAVNMKAGAVKLNNPVNIQAISTPFGGSVPHNNMSPYLTLSYIICLYGVFPPRDGGGLGSSAYIGEIKMFAGSFAPAGWLLCDGQSLPISENDALFNLIGTTYGGDGINNFNIPDLRGRVPIGQGQGSGLQNRVIGETGGTEHVTLATNQIPNHQHNVTQQTQTLNIFGEMEVSDMRGNSPLPEGNVLAVGSRNEQIYSAAFSGEKMKADIIDMNLTLADTDVTSITSPVGGSQPHNNLMPSVAINYIISTSGIYPSVSSGSSNDFLGAISMFAFNFAPGGYALCNGQFLPINQNQALFSLLGTYYGGNGQTNFALPDLRGRAAIDEGNGFTLGQKGGEETHTLTSAEMPVHSHFLTKGTSVTASGTIKGTNTTGNTVNPVGAVPARGFKNERIYSSVPNRIVGNFADITLNVGITPKDISGNPVTAPGGVMTVSIGGSQPHDNMQPYAVITFAIALSGIYPSQN